MNPELPTPTGPDLPPPTPPRPPEPPSPSSPLLAEGALLRLLTGFRTRLRRELWTEAALYAVAAATLLRRLQTQRYAFPVYVVAYRYRGRLFRTVVSGQDPTRLLGRAPYSAWKIFGVVGAVLLAVALLAVWWPVRRATRLDPVEILRAE